MIERLPTPWGLVRLGVAPDHPQLKTVSRAFEKIAARPGFRFLGNVEVGRDVTHEELASLYDAVIYAVGSQTDRRLGIPGEDLPGSWAATELVAWYNGHPDFQHLEFDLSHERAVVIGNGNVALDVARMLALTQEELAPTDTTDAAIDAIVCFGIREIVVLGRRGPGPGGVDVDRARRAGRARGRGRRRRPGRARARSRERGRARGRVERRSAKRRDPARVRRRASRRASRVSCGSGSAPRPSRSSATTRVEGVEIVRNRLEPDGRGSVRAVPTDEREVIPCGIVFRSVGYRGVGVPGRAVRRAAPARSRTTSGRVLDEGGAPVPGLYCAGWIKRGPTGVIGTNKKDATETVERLLEDARAGRLPAAVGPRVEELLAERGVERRHVRGLGGDRRARARARRAAGPPAHQARPRWDELLDVARSA